MTIIHHTSRILLFAFLIVATSASSQDYLISDGGTVTTCTGTIYDSGGPNGDYSNNEDYVMTFCSGDPAACLQFVFVQWEVEGSNWDDLTVYDGPDINSPVIGVYDGDEFPGIIGATGSCLTLRFDSDGSIVFPGFQIDITCVCPTCFDGIQNGQELAVDCGGPECPPCSFYVISEEGSYTDCSVELLDSGVGSSYDPDEDYTMTFCSDGTADCWLLDFLVLDITFGDTLFIYAGTDTSGPLLETIVDGVVVDSLQYSLDCITYRFVSNGFVEGQGFYIDMECTTLCPACDDGILNGQELDVDCGGPDCPSCPFVVMNGSSSINTCEAVIFDNGFDENYDNNSEDVLTMCADFNGGCMYWEFESFDLETGFDFLTLYAGPDVNSPQIGTFTGSDSPGIVDPGTTCITARFTSDGSVTDPGYVINASCQCPSCDDGILNGQELATDCGGPDCPECDFHSVSEGGTLTGCDFQIYDSGIEGPYSANENYVLTVCSEDDLDSLYFEFTSVAIGIGDHLYIYDGESVAGELLADVTAAVNWDSFFSPGACVTLNFVSNETGNSQGFLLDLSCASDIVNSVSQFEVEQMDIRLIEQNILFVNQALSHSSELELIDVLGRVRYSGRLIEGQRIDLSHIESGIYIVAISSQGKYISSQSIRIQH